ncbi:dTDP-4-dehydrorhamnose reductase [Pedobacter sp. UYP30]|uniref:dTDP-4-dehydrorhamnose reductase n=1 Tax=Pedobacter sp. UYP30 TaxID=1756400 RepID=UPI0033996CA5
MGKIVVIGAGGQLGQCLRTVAAELNIGNVVFPGEGEANILNVEQLNGLLGKEEAKYVINCAAYTAVDQAEDDKAKARAINETGAANLAEACKAHGATLVHISTDFVFRGNEVKLLTEEDVAEPINVYGETKLDGEQAISSVLKEHYILRTSWLYSEFGNNFAKTMLKLGAERDELNIIADQVGTPTYGIDLANTIFEVIAKDEQKYGLYHYSNDGVTSWYDFAKAIFELSGTQVKVNPIPGASYPTRAKRPSFSVMDKTKIKETFEVEIPYWRDSLAVCIGKIKEQG